ncbi:MAG: nucleotide exchange factor GrpE [Chloroflexi bacterium]|nr:nucleotide exchange factor GrpE [Chloroflexota bacterium]
MSDEKADKEQRDVIGAEAVVDTVEGNGVEQAQEVSPDGRREATEPSLEEKLATAEAKAAEYLEGWQRTLAEFANARKRMERQQAEAYVNAGVDHARKLLPVLDDFERALNSAPQGIKQDPWFEGIVLLRRKLQNVLEELKVEQIQAVGQPFDPNFHEALSLKESDEYESGTVIEELQAGYKLGDRVIRPALVNVVA